MAFIAPRTHVAKVEILFDQAQVNIRYLDSVNLKYAEKKGKRSIHKAYNKWVKGLAASIAQFQTDGDLEAIKKESSDPIARMFPTNPAPARKFSDFSHFEVLPVALNEEYVDNDTAEKVQAKLQENFDIRLGDQAARWNQAADGNGSSLRIEPLVEKVRFVSAGTRLFAGAFAGNSHILMRVKYLDASTGEVVAEPQFFLRVGGRNTFMGIGDNLMLPSMAQLILEYTQGNYEEAVGGPAGDPYP